MGLLALIASRFTQIKSCERVGEQVSRDLLQQPNILFKLWLSKYITVLNAAHLLLTVCFSQTCVAPVFPIC